MSEKEQEKEELFGVRDGILYGIGCGIGGSVFVLLGTGINRAGPGVIISLIMGAILILLTGLNYSELSASLPYSGGAYNFSKEGLGGFLAFIIGFFLWIANIATCSFSAQAFGLILTILFPAITPLEPLIVIISVLFMSFVVFHTQKRATKTHLIFTSVLISIIIFYIVSGLFIAPYSNISGYNPSVSIFSFEAFSVIQMFSILFIFFNSITSNLAYFNASLKNPSKNIPKVNIIAICLTSVIYIMITIATLVNFQNISGNEADSPVVLALIMNNILGPVGYFIMGIASLISTIISMNAAIGSAVSVLHALARDNYIPEKFKEINKNNVPTLVLITTTVIAIVMSFLAIVYGNIGFTGEITTFIYFFALAFVNFAAVALRYRRKELARPFKAPFFPYLPIIAGSACLMLAFVLEPRAIIIGSVFLTIGLVYYLLKLADRHSIIITLAGMKFLAVLIIGLLIWIIKNFGILASPIVDFELVFDQLLMRVLIVICVVSIGIVFLDVVPLREIVIFFTKKLDKEKVAISMGNAKIIELKKSRLKIIYGFDMVIGIIQIVFTAFIFILASLVLFDIVSISQISIGTTVIPEISNEFVFVGVLFFLGTSLLLSSFIYITLYREVKSLGI